MQDRKPGPQGGLLLPGRIREMMERLAREGATDESGWTPSVDIYETKEAVVVIAELAGVTQNEVKVIVDGQVVRIYGHREPTCCTKGARFHRMEIASGGFTRSFRIGVPFDAQGVKAVVEDGLLVITLPKKDPESRNIQVRQG